MMSIRSFSWSGLVALALVLATPPPAPAAPAGESFEYPLRPGESLSDVAQIFRVPVETLIEHNRLAQVDRLRIGQRIEVPNAFAAEAAARAAERDQAIAASERLARDLAASREMIAGLEQTVGDRDLRVRELSTSLATIAHWELAAKGAAALALALFVWTLKLGHERAVLTRRSRSLTKENQALAIARQRTREALAQVELRYQQLYAGKGQAKKKTVEDGLTRLERTFENGVHELERLASRIERDREQEERLLETQQKALGWLFHPVREWITRTRLKEHAS